MHNAGAIFLAGLLALVGCGRYGVVDDGTTVSFGRSYDGILKNGTQLPPWGEGYWVPSRWVRRGNQYGTEETIAMIVRVGRRVFRETGGARLGVADLSPRGGGSSPWHRSHQTGRDVDMLYFAVDYKGRPLRSKAMVRFKGDGSSHRIDSHGIRRSKRSFDVERNWILIRALLEEQTVEVQYIYMYEPLIALLLDHARKLGEPEELIARAEAVMEQPVDSSPHDDHLHVRLFCPENDRPFGCLDGRTPRIDTEADFDWQGVLLGAAFMRAVVKLAVMAV